jgi:hypothetical protein
MKTRYSILILMFLFVITASYSQESGKKSKEERKLELQKQTEDLMNSKIFLFVGNTAYSEGGKSVAISSGPNTVSFSPDLIKSNLPFFGTAKTASAGYGGQSGYTFEGKPDEYTVDSTKKGYTVKAVVKSGNDNFTMNLTISPEGGANLSVYSINRSSMRYNGEIRKED